MQTNHISRENILAVSRELLCQQGWQGLQIRAVATQCKVAVGSIYNYFSSKTELVAATIQSVWQEIFHDEKCKPCNTIEYVVWLFSCLEKGACRYPGFFSLHAMGFLEVEKQEGQKRMYATWQHIKEGLHCVMRQDTEIAESAFDETFTVEDFADILFAQMLAALIQQKYDTTAVQEMIRRCLYQK